MTNSQQPLSHKAGELQSEQDAVAVAVGYSDRVLDRGESAEGIATDAVAVVAADLISELRPTTMPVSNVLIAVTVHESITNTDVPHDATPTTYDLYTVVVDRSSGGVVGICMGCDSAVNPSR